MKYSVGIGLTDKCNLKCPHCYSRSGDAPAFLPAETVMRLCESLEIKDINFGTGESWLHPQFLEIVKALRDEQMEMALTTNGYTVAKMSDQELRLFQEIDFSLDFPNEPENDSWRGGGSFRSVTSGIYRCQEAGCEVSVACCLMNNNYKYMGKMVELCAGLGVHLRINVYKPVHTNAYKPSYSEFWEGIRLLLGNSRLVSCSEPIVNALMGHRPSSAGGPCGKGSLRVKPSGEIIPCVYWRDTGIFVDDILANGSEILEALVERVNMRHIPEVCNSCSVLDICGGGCAGRRVHESLLAPDEYCFMLRGDIPDIKFRWASSRDLVHSGYLCTLIVDAG